MRFSALKVHLAFLAILTLGLTSAPSKAFAQAAAPAMTASAPAADPTSRIAALEKQVADNTAATAAAQTAGDNGWMLVSSALVLMMSIPGLALFYGGLVRKKNILGTMMQTFAMCAVITVLWALVTYSLAFSSGSAFIGGFSNVLLHGVGLQLAKDYAPTIPLQTFMVYQLMFAIITPALITGAFAERVKFSAMLVFMVLWAFIVYSPMAHMVWGIGGLLNVVGGKFPCLDFAGGTVVHVTSGVSALVTALYLGKRLGYPKVPMPPHSVVLSFIGAGLLWVGWFGFNAGSALGAGTLATSAFVATHFGAAAAALGWSAAEWIKNGKPSALGAISGAVAGLVGITPAAGFVTPMSALWIGLIVGIFCFFMVVTVKALFGYDDSLDAFGVHGAGGTMGALLTGIFANSVINPVFGAGKATGALEGNPHQLLNQLTGVAIAWTLSIVGTLIILVVVDKTIGLRVSEEDEREGLDLSQHGEEGYDWAH
ncbi:ammonium transporter [Granulicella tundricola]|uniref:Ammonium transporter n=1 Tax=Granulicella tundricola (strain ATCC BAA-1859 / DSM 23138 / MP5ACTX9) TaxID=1198114 RepID=E8X388_GRATM|nr:ammonium transporter [Granulicella tundricola]ADW69312.1 ammonium transporter [Granulicella tundricola MP5ACTX9]